MTAHLNRAAHLNHTRKICIDGIHISNTYIFYTHYSNPTIILGANKVSISSMSFGKYLDLSLSKSTLKHAKMH